MNVGACQIRIRLPENQSLKGKRGVVKSIIARVSGKFNVCMAEVGDLDAWQIATLGMCVVSNDAQHNDEVLAKAVDFIIHGCYDVEVLDYEIELISVF